VKITVYISIGNSDDKLRQKDWSAFVSQARAGLRQTASAIHGEWYSAPDAACQNACFCAEFTSQARVDYARELLTDTRTSFGQDSVAWAVAQTEFI